MKFFNYGQRGSERAGAIDREGVARDISSLYPQINSDSLGSGLLREVKLSDLAEFPALRDDIRFGPCVLGVRHFIAVGLNYSDHAAESGADAPEEPILFNKAPSCIIGPNDDVRLPPGSTKSDWEVELAVVIGSHAYQIGENEAQSVIAGYCVCNDLSEREYQLETSGQWMKGKSCPTFGPLGPYLVTPDELVDVQNLQLWLDVNGERMQSGRTSNMIFSVNYIVSYISKFMQLEPGDIITTGTPPGVGLGFRPPRFLKAGDQIALGIEGLGEQRQNVIAEKKRQR